MFADRIVVRLGGPRKRRVPEESVSDQQQPLLSWEADSPDQFEELIRPVAPGVTIDPQGRHFRAQVQMVPLSHTGLFAVRIDDTRVLSPDTPFISVTVPLVNGFEATIAGRSTPVPVGTAFIHPAYRPIGKKTASNTGRMLVFNLWPEHLGCIAGALEGTGPGSDVNLVSSVSLATPEGAEFYRRLVRVWRVATRPNGTSRLHLLEEEKALVVALLRAGHALSAEGGSTIRQQSVRRVRRVREYIEAHATAPTSLADLATVAGMRADTLCRAFRKQHGVGPVTYLRQRRLEAAQRMLLGADPESTTVIRAALKYGFAHMSRFASTYRQAFGELPSATLAR